MNLKSVFKNPVHIQDKQLDTVKYGMHYEPEDYKTREPEYGTHFVSGWDKTKKQIQGEDTGEPKRKYKERETAPLRRSEQAFASNCPKEVQTAASQYIDQWCHDKYVREEYLRPVKSEADMDTIELLFMFWLTKPKEASTRNLNAQAKNPNNPKARNVGESELDSLWRLINENNFNEETSWQQKLKAGIKKFCAKRIKDVYKTPEWAEITQNIGSHESYESRWGGADYASSKYAADRSDDIENMGRSRQEIEAEMEEQDELYGGFTRGQIIRKFKQMSPEQQRAFIKQFGTAQDIKDPKWKKLYMDIRHFVNKGTPLKDSKIKDEDAGPAQGLTADQWPAEVEDPNTGEMKSVGKKADSKEAARPFRKKVNDCGACEGAAGLSGAGNVDGNAITTEADMGPMVPGGLKKKKKTNDAAYSNPGDRPQRAQFKSDADYQRALSRWEYALQQHVDRPCDSKVQDSAHTWKVYYLDTQRQRTNCIFVKAFSVFEAESLAEEKLPNYCIVQSATDTTPFAEDDDED